MCPPLSHRCVLHPATRTPRPPSAPKLAFPLLLSLESTLHKKRVAVTKPSRSMSLLVLKSRNGSLFHSQGEPRFLVTSETPHELWQELWDA